MRDIENQNLKRRLKIMGAVLLLLFFVVFQRFYMLQVVDGEEYRQQFADQIQREQVYSGSRGIIYDRNGNELAYNELSYTITIEDSGAYENRTSRNEGLNRILNQAMDLIEGNGDSVMTYLPITVRETGGYEFTSEGTSLQRFRADVYGRSDISDLTYNRRLGYDEGTATAQQVMDYLCSASMYGIAGDMGEERMLQVASLRYAMSGNNYRRYIKTDLAGDVGEETVAAILEHQAVLTGVDVSEGMVRRYNDSQYVSHILGYTGPVSEEELAAFAEQGLSYDRNDVVGKAGIEQAMESELHGRNGGERFLVDSMGRVTEVLETREASTGNHVYLTIDIDLQKAVYELLEQKLAGILLANIVPDETGDADDLSIPIQEVYYALINNRVIDIDRFAEEDAGAESKNVQAILDQEQIWYLSQLPEVIRQPYGSLEETWQEGADYVLELLAEAGVYRRDDVNRTTEGYEQWRDGESSLEEYLMAGISEGYVVMEQDVIEGGYASLEDTWNSLEGWIYDRLREDDGFVRLLYRQLLQRGAVTGAQICRILLEQGVVQDGEGDYENLGNGTVGAYGFIREKIRNLEITPAQLALDPSTASSVVVDPNTGQVLANVTYPGYDLNRLANTVDAAYYRQLLDDASLPLYNNATQQRTAPGSVFKPIMVAAGLTEPIITPETVIEDHGVFEEIVPSPRCWIHSSGATHGAITVREALRDSCNYFFYSLGYQFSLEDQVYQESKGIETIRKYTELFGLGEHSGIEITESAPQIADGFPVVAAIGQSNHNYTTTQLARYAATLANKGTLYDLTLIDRIQAGDSEEIREIQEPSARSLDEIVPEAWDVIAEGMQMMAADNRTLNQLSISVAGKTGTAQQNANRPNHALFIGYAPYEQPQISVATRIAYGYSSSNAVEVTSDIIKYYFGIEDASQLLTGQAEIPENRGNSFAD